MVKSRLLQSLNYSLPWKLFCRMKMHLRLLLLQNAAFLPMFRQAMGGRGRVGESRLDELKPARLREAKGDALKDIFRDVSRDREAASQKVLAYLQDGIGYPVKTDMPGIDGPAVERLYADGAAWLADGTLNR